MPSGPASSEGLKESLYSRTFPWLGGVGGRIVSAPSLVISLRMGALEYSLLTEPVRLGEGPPLLASFS